MGHWEEKEMRTQEHTQWREQKIDNFKYPKAVYNHYQYRDVIDNNNSMRMSPISMEETWMTSQWSN